MAPIVSAIDIACPPREVFACIADPARLPEWQQGVVDGRLEGGGPPAAGARFAVTTRIGGAEQVSALEITEFQPPGTWAVRGLDGPVRVLAKVTVEPRDGAARSFVTITVDFEGHGAGRALVPLVVRPQAAKQAPESCRRLKGLLEKTA